MIRIRKKREIEFVALGKFLQTLDRVGADGEHHRIQCCQLGLHITQTTGLHGATRCHGLGIEIQQYVLRSAQGRELHRAPLLITEDEVGG